MVSWKCLFFYKKEGRGPPLNLMELIQFLFYFTNSGFWFVEKINRSLLITLQKSRKKNVNIML